MVSTELANRIKGRRHFRVGEVVRGNHLKITVCIFLAALTFFVYQQVVTHNFINYDDTVYITDNPRMVDGLSWDNIEWAFRTTYFSNWHPITWLSYFLNAQALGVNAPAFLLINVFLHIANTLLLFLLFNSMTKCLWRSALLAALFAIHPLHVESVAWASERKDVLSTFFGILTFGAYLSYVNREIVFRYMKMFSLFVLGMMAKPMLISLPFVLLLLDYWPLNRVDFSDSPQWIYRTFKPLSGRCPFSVETIKKSPATLVKEKIPLFVIAAISGGITIIAQRNGGAIAPVDMLPIGFRVANALISYGTYLIHMFWPYRLSIFYPYPDILPWWQILAAGSTLIIISCLTLKYASRFPYLIVGWLWYLGTLVPVIGLLQVGRQAMADRYTYIPLIGIFLSLVWLVTDLTSFLPKRKIVLCLLATVTISCLSIRCFKQVGYWKDSITILKHALEVTSRNATAHTNYGVELAKKNRISEAIEQYKAAIRINPLSGLSYNDLGLALSQQGRLEKALLCFKQAHRLAPKAEVVVKNYKRVSRILREKLNAIAKLEKKVTASPPNADLLIRIGNAYQQIHKIKEAIVNFKDALKIDDSNITAHNALAIAYAMDGRYAKAEEQCKRNIEIQPQNANTYYQLASLYGRQNRKKLAFEWLSKAIEKGFDNWTYVQTDPNFNSLRSYPAFANLIQNR